MALTECNRKCCTHNVSFSQSIISTVECIKDNTLGRLTGSDLFSNRFGPTGYSNRLGGAYFRLAESIVEPISILTGSQPIPSSRYLRMYISR